MTREPQSDTLVVLVADRDAEEALAVLLRRHRPLRTREFRFDIVRHPGRDAGCRSDAANFLRQYLITHRYGLVILDRQGCGSEGSREHVEDAIEAEVSRNGWQDRARAVVIDPELEEWVWADDPAVAASLGWEAGYPSLRSWLVHRRLWDEGRPKPHDPKRAMIHALRGAPPRTRRRRSARIFGKIAANAPVEHCSDPAVIKLRDTLRRWFPSNSREGAT